MLTYIIQILIIWCIIEIYAYFMYIKRRNYIANYKHLTKDCNNEIMIKYYLDRILNSKTYYDNLGKYCNKTTKDLSYLEISQIIHTFVFGRQRKIKLNEVIEYKKIIFDIKKIYGYDNFHSNNINIQSIHGLAKFKIIYKSFFVRKILVNVLHFFFDIFMKYYHGFEIYYDNLTHYKFYSKIKSDNQPTYVFLHGIGIGMCQYFNVVSVFGNFNDKNIIYVDIPNLSYRKDFDYLDDRIIFISFDNYFLQNKIKNINLICHSYGGIVANKMLRNIDISNNKIYTIDKVYLIEFSGFLINSADTAKFVYYEKNDDYLSKYLSFNELNIEQQFSKTDTTINNCMCISYYSKIICFLAKNDKIVNYELNLTEFDDNNIKFYSYDGTHGAFCLNSNITKMIKNIIINNQ